MRGIARITPTRNADPLLGAWDDLALLRHVRRPDPAHRQADPKDYDDILHAFAQIRRAAPARPARCRQDHDPAQARRRPGATRARGDPTVPLPLLVSLGDWTGAEPFEAFLADRLPEVGDGVRPLHRAGRLILHPANGFGGACEYRRKLG